MTRLRGWRLFWLLTALSTVVVFVALQFTSLDTREGIEEMIRWGVRCGIFYYIVIFAASALFTLWPNRSTRWLLSNRRYIGLAFAAAFTWQLVFIVYLRFAYPEYFAEFLFTFSTITAGVVAYGFLYLMSITSFRPFSQYLTPAQWRVLHKGGMYAFWYIFAVGYVARALRGGPATVWYVIVAALLIGGALLRVAAWLKQPSSTDLWNSLRTAFWDTFGRKEQVHDADGSVQASKSEEVRGYDRVSDGRAW